MSDLSSIVPRLDDVEFEQLVEQARALIPRYAPEWTDHNLHDPGITVIDLLAWIVDQQTYRVGFVGGRYRAAFAALLGPRVRGPRPARGLVWPARTLGAVRRIKPGTPVICSRHPDLAVATEWELVLTSAAIRGIKQVAGEVEVPIPTGGGAGSTILGGVASLADTTLVIGFDRPLTTSTDAAPVPLGVEVVPPPGAPPSPDLPWGPIDVAYRVGAGPWMPVEIDHDGTAGLSTTGVVVLGIPPVVSPTGGSELRLRFDRGFFPVTPQIRAMSVNVLPIVQQRLERAARLADGTGRPDQLVSLATTDLTEPPDRPDGPVLEIEVAGERWEERRDLAGSGPDDRHYVVGLDHLRFGNGVNGRRPPLGSAITHTGLARTKGAEGNVRPGLTWSVEVLDADGVGYGVNRQPLTGGADATLIDELAAEAREAATSRRVLLTDRDLITAATELPGLAVGRAEVLSGFDRRFPDRRIGDARTLVVVPCRSGSPAGPGPSASVVPSGYLAQVAARLEPRRVLGERLLVQSPVVIPVNVWLTATVEEGVPPEEVRQAVVGVVRGRLAVLARLDEIEPWPLGRTVTTAEIETLAVGVNGVVTVTSVEVARAGEPPGRAPISLPRDGLAEAAGVEVVARPAAAAGAKA
jgi:hypothetical protein